MNTCKNHKDRTAIYSCKKCEEIFCGDCIYDVNGLDYCSECSQQMKLQVKSGFWKKLVDSV